MQQIYMKINLQFQKLEELLDKLQVLEILVSLLNLPTAWEDMLMTVNMENL